MKSRLALAILWPLCLLAAVVGLAWMLAAMLTNSQRAWAIAVGFDQVGNATTGGDPDETISSRCWRYRTEQPYRALRGLIDFAFGLAGDREHCKRAFIKEHADAIRRAAPLSRLSSIR